MKKIFATFAVLLTLLLVCACQKKDYFDLVSQIRCDVYEGTSDSVDVKAFYERREYPLNSDGYANELHDYIVIKLTFQNPQNSVITDLSVNFSLSGKNYSASLAFSAQANDYVATVAVDEPPKDELTVTVNAAGAATNVILSKIKTDMISPEKALKAAIDKKSQLIKSLEDSNAPFEFMIRVVLEGNSQFYYVGIVEADYTTALLVSSDGKVLAEKRLKNQ